MPRVDKERASGRPGPVFDRTPGAIRSESLASPDCLNPYVACRKDAVGVSNVIVQSIVTGSEIGPLVTARSLIKESGP